MLATMNVVRPDLKVRVQCIRYESEGVLSFELRALDDAPLPDFHAGAHIDLYLPNGLVRSYSLLDPDPSKNRYLIAVNKDRESRGGSAYLHKNMRPGDVLTISPPRNNFPLNAEGGHSVLIAGGIGITPLLSMAQRLAASERSWELFYCARTRASAAFVETLERLAQPGLGKVTFNFDQEPGGGMLDIPRVVSAAPPGTHFYCCGPVPMLEAFERATSTLPLEFVHVEYFKAKEEPDTSGHFTVELARSRRSVQVPEGRTILETLIEAGVDPPYSCMEGVCGACETRVLAGEPDHRDLVLTKEQQLANQTMMICCSGCKGDRLVLDL